MVIAIVDYESGNLHSAQKAFQRMASETGAGEVIVTADPEVVRRADRLVLPGDGAFPACRAALMERSGLFEAIEEAVTVQARPFLGICIGMQMLATEGLEYQTTPGFDWIGGTIRRLAPAARHQKVPHMGWNDLQLTGQHPVLNGIETGDHVYFVHSYHMDVRESSDRLAFVDYGQEVTSIVARDTIIGMQFHPEKSQAVGLRLIANFLEWRP